MVRIEQELLILVCSVTGYDVAPISCAICVLL